LVTGASGFIGGHLAVALARAGADVRALCRYNSRADRGTLAWFSRDEVEALEIRFGDLRQIESVDQAMAGCDAVFHLGAQVAIPYSYVNPREFFDTNLTGSLNVAQAARRAEVSRVIHVSTSEVYGEPVTLPIDEQHRVMPRSPYAASKAAADLLMMSFNHSYGLPVVVVRPFNTYGPHQSARAIVPTIISQALQGGVVRLGRLDPRRDLTFVTDTVGGMLAVGAAEATVGRVINLGSGEDTSVGELVTLAGELLGRELQVEVDLERVRPSASEISQLRADPSLARRSSGWEARTQLRQGLAETIEWIRVHASAYRPFSYAI
jgi:nucleoside-diphosphate-sugar epimerase